MERLRIAREARGYSLKKIAEVVGHPEDEVALWEAGEAQPTEIALCDLAVLYGTGIDDLHGTNPLCACMSTNSVFSLGEGDEYLWGHLGVLLPGQTHSKWYPITLGQAREIDAALQDLEPDYPWIAVRTLNNRMLLLHVPHLLRLQLLEERADEPADDWKMTWDSPAGHSPEVYRALCDRWWQIERLYSQVFADGIKDLVLGERLTERMIRTEILDTIVHTKNGHEHRCMPSDASLWGAVEATTTGFPSLFDLSDADKGLSTYYPADHLRMIDMPLFQVVDGAKEAALGMAQVHEAMQAAAL